MSSLHNDHDYNDSCNDYQEKQYHGHSDDTFIKDDTQTGMNCHHSSATGIVSMGDGAGDSVLHVYILAYLLILWEMEVEIS